MRISIKSEVDSRMLLYPLIKVLADYGTICVLSGNPEIEKLIDDDVEGGFRNIRIIRVYDGDLQGAIEDEGLTPNKYSFTIYDNVGAQQYEKLICIVTNVISDEYLMDLKNLIDEPQTSIMKFGTPGKKVEEKKSKGKATDSENANSELPSLHENNRWLVEKTPEDLLVEALSDKKIKWCKMPSMQDIITFEQRHTFFVPDDSVLKEIYRVLPDAFNVDERVFIKGGRMKDESSISFNGTEVW